MCVCIYVCLWMCDVVLNVVLLVSLKVVSWFGFDVGGGVFV